MSVLHSILAWLGLGALLVGAIYSTLTYVAVLVWHLKKTPPAAAGPTSAVSILKPLCGAEPGLYENLRSFCRQDFVEFEVIFGVCNEDDAALEVTKRLIVEFPLLQMSVVIDSRQHGCNRKVSSLINMAARAKHNLLVIADSDARVKQDYLAAVIAPLANSQVGLVTTIYRGMPTPGVWSSLGAMYVNEWYVPSVLLAWLFGHRNYVSGQTICLRRETLEAIGGFSALADHLADDYRLGEMVRRTGKTIILSDYVPRAEHHETGFTSMTRHELRWMRTLKVLKPGSFRLLFLTFSLPVSLVGMGLCGSFFAHFVPASCLFCLTVLMRIYLHLSVRRPADSTFLVDLWLIPLRDLLVLWVWLKAFQSTPITWRGTEFRVDRDGVMRPSS